MAERLTEEYYYTWDENGTKKLSYIQKLQNKLGKLEDILEKYGIESLDTLEHIIKKGQVITSTIEGFAKEAYNEIQTDRDTWKRACELACEEIDSCDNYGCKTYTIPLKEMPQYFYQQAKKGG